MDIYGEAGERLVAELEGLSLGDWRLERRARQMVSAWADAPAASLPEALQSEAAIEAGYRFLSNDKVSVEKLLQPHIRSSATRCAREERVLVLHDSTTMHFAGEAEREGLSRKGDGHEFTAHFGLAVSGDRQRRPLGVVAFEARPPRAQAAKGRTADRRDPNRASLRWVRGQRAAAQVLKACREVVHVMDREGDFYELLSDMVSRGSRFVVRALHDRIIALGDADAPQRLWDASRKSHLRLQREVRLSRRTNKGKAPKAKKEHPTREARTAKLEVGALALKFRRPDLVAANLPEQIELNVVWVREVDPPAAEERVEWLLITSEPIDTPDQIAEVVDIYRDRWVIEEYFKAIKTGCAFELRRMESRKTLLNTLGLLIPMAYELLLLKTLVLRNPTAPATQILTPARLVALRAICRKLHKLPPRASVRHVMEAIARLGGFLKRNHSPGWQVLARGYRTFLLQERGWLAAKA